MDTATAIVLAVCVAIIGLPHGGLDHLFGRRLIEPMLGRWWRLTFAMSYVGVAGLVLGGWWVAPIVTLVLFLAISAYHFGTADGRSGIIGLVEGGALIWVPLLTQPEEMATLLSWVMPSGRVDVILAAITEVRPLVWIVALIYAKHVLSLLAHREIWSVLRLVTFVVGFARLPILVSFGLYFCGWHSVRELADLARRANPTRPWQGLVQVIRHAMLRAALVVMAAIAAAWWFASGQQVTPLLVQSIFLSLSAVAVPHILLHVVTDRYGTDPFAQQIAVAHAPSDQECQLCPIAATT